MEDSRARARDPEAALGIVDHLRRGFPRFKLRAHFLDLCSLFFQGCDETCHRRFLKRNAPYDRYPGLRHFAGE